MTRARGAQALEANTSIWGTGVTSEGIDQNPALYDFIFAQVRPNTAAPAMCHPDVGRLRFTGPGSPDGRSWEPLART